jgi:hypothetical protein
MRIELRSAIAMMVIAVAAGPRPTGAQKPHTAQVQMTFNAEDDGVQHPVALPEQVKALLRQQDAVQYQLKDANLEASQLPDSWFSASAIHLHADGSQPDLIVQAEGPLLGANVDTFWILLASDNGYRLVLTISTHSLNVLPARWKGYRRLEVADTTCCAIGIARYRFNGTGYEKYEEKTKNIR